MAIPMYGQNKEGSVMNVFADCLKLVEFDLTIAASSPADNADTGYDIPANYMPLFSVVKNTGANALDAGATYLDMETSETHLTGELNALASGASQAMVIINTLSADNTLDVSDSGSYTTAKNILVDGNMYSASGTTLNVRIWCLDATALSGLDISSFPG